jgi:glycosidase
VPAGATSLALGSRGGSPASRQAVLRLRPFTSAEAPFNHWTIYHVMMGFFRNGSVANDGAVRGWKHPRYAGGDLQGVLEKADYLRDLGVDAVWLSPIFAARTSHGYDVTNYYQIGDAVAVPGEPEASLALFRQVRTALAERGIRTILDLPLNHASRSYDRDAGDPQGLKPRSTGARQEAEKVWESWGGGFRYWNFDHPPTRRFLTGVALHWLVDEGVDGLRLDYVRGVPHDYWAELDAAVKKAKPGAFLVGECWLDGEGPEANARDIATYYQPVPGAGPQLDSLLDFPLQMVMTDVFARSRPATALETWLQATAALYGAAATPTYFLDNHDLSRFADWGASPARVAAAVGFMSSLSGPVVLFYGTETGLAGGGAPQTGFTDTGRVPMPWEALDRDLGARVSAALAARAAHPALTRGARLPLLAADDLLVMAKVGQGEVALVGVNLSSQPRTVELTTAPATGGAFAAALGNAIPEATEAGGLRWTLPAESTSIAVALR